MRDASIFLGAVAHDAKVLTYWEAMREYFRAQGVALEFVLFSSYEAQVEALLAGLIDVAQSSPLAHVRAKRRSEGKLRLIATRDVDRDVQTKVLVRRDANIRALSDLEGHTLAVGSRDSAHARVLPLYFLKRSGVDLARLALMTFELDIGKHGDCARAERSVLEAIHEGKAQAGAVGSLVWQAAHAAGEVDPRAVETLWTTPTYDNHVLEALGTITETKVQALQRVLFDLRWNNPKHRKLLELDGVRQWLPAREDGYVHVESAFEDPSLL